MLVILTPNIKLILNTNKPNKIQNMKKLLLLLVAAAIGFTATAQRVKVISTKQVALPAGKTAFHPKFMPDGRLLVTAADFTGLAIVNAETKAYTTLTDLEGAGYYPAISEDGKAIVTRRINGQTFTQDLYKLDVATKKLTTIATNVDHVNQVCFKEGEVTYAMSSKAKKARLQNVALPVTAVKTYVTEEDLKIVVYQGSSRRVLDPLAGQFGDWDAQYCWTSLSPNGKKITFTCRNNSYVCNLDGTGLVDLGKIRAPQWCGDTHVVGMRDLDDGHDYTASEIMIVKSNGTGLQQLSTTSSEIKMFPAASADGNQIAFNTLDGKLYLMTIQK